MAQAASSLWDIHKLNRWKDSLSATQHSILEVAYKLYVAQQASGTCYNCAFFLCYYLKKKYGIDGRVEVGFIHDGVHPRTPSHAWYVHKGHITDVSISRPLNPHLIRPGPLTILGRDIITGWPWHYYTANSAQGVAAIEEMKRKAATAIDPLAVKALDIHLRMSAIARSKSAMRAYLDKCPPGMNYRDLVTAMKLIDLNGEAINHGVNSTKPSALSVAGERIREQLA